MTKYGCSKHLEKGHFACECVFSQCRAALPQCVRSLRRTSHKCVCSLCRAALSWCVCSLCRVGLPECVCICCRVGLPQSVCSLRRILALADFMCSLKMIFVPPDFVCSLRRGLTLSGGFLLFLISCAPSEGFLASADSVCPRRRVHSARIPALMMELCNGTTTMTATSLLRMLHPMQRSVR